MSFGNMHDDAPQRRSGFSRRKIMIVVGIVLIPVLLGSWLWWTSFQNKVENEGKTQQRSVQTLQTQVATALSNCLDSSNIASQVAVRQSAEVRKTIVDAVSARYESKNGANNNDVTQVGIRNSFLAMQERYPQVDTKVWEHLMTVATGCRSEVKGAQDHLQQYAGVFDTWRLTGGLLDRGIRRKFPTNSLVATNPLTSEVYHGQKALGFLTRLILTGEAKKAVGKGEMPEQSLFPSAPTPKKK